MSQHTPDAWIEHNQDEYATCEEWEELRELARCDDEVTQADVPLIAAACNAALKLALTLLVMLFYTFAR